MPRWCVCLLLPLAASARDLATRDGLLLRLDDQGAVTGLRLDRQDLRLTRPGGLFVADVAGLPAREDELLGNPGFEAGPTAWSAGADWSLDDTTAHAGKRSMKVSLAEKGRSGSLAVELPAQPNTPYRVSLWMKTAGCAPAYYIVQLDAQGRARASHPQICISHANLNSDWFHLTTDVTTAPFCRTLRVYTCIWEQSGTAWIDDASVVCLADDYLTPQQPALGRVEPAADGAKLTWESAEQHLAIDAVWHAAADHLELAGEVRDTSGADRAVAVSFRLPIDAAGWTWYDDLHNQQTIEPVIGYGSARVLGERRTIALYPFAALGNPDAALALAVPLDQPRIFRLTYDTVHGYCLNYEFGLARDAAKNPSRAAFRCVLYRLDPRWGFRSAAQRYYDLFPQFFTRRLDRLGGAGFMQDVEAWDRPDIHPAAVSIWDYWKREANDLHRREGTKLFQYTEFSGWWGWALGITPEKAKVKPTPEEAWRNVEAIARGEGPNHDVARCVLNCAPYGRDGKPLLHDSYNAEWGGYMYLCSPDPEIEGIDGKLNRVSLTYQREVAQVEPNKLDGMYYDCAFVFAVDNYRREHFRWADAPLVFDHVTKQPVLPMLFSIFECAKAIADDMHGRGKLVIANYSVTDLPTEMYCALFVDLLGNEMLWTWTTDAKLSLQRVLAHQKPISMSWQEAKLDWPDERKERELKQAMFYGTFYQLSRLDPVIRERWVPLTTLLAEAGWEPLTLAHAAGAAPVLLERFGRAADGNLHFTLRNEGEQEAAVTLRLEAAKLGLAADADLWLARDSWGSDRLPVAHGAAGWTAKLSVSAGDTVVLRVGTAADLARDQLSAVPDLLWTAEAFRDALVKAGVAVTAPDYPATRAALAGVAIEPAALQALAARLAEPQLADPTDEKRAWARRLRETTSLARRRVEAAGGLAAR
ncbi:MAG: hypothetical protein HYU66_09190 [Armatimonadetes bacterium]|nr:hypothetical protein [Armatimonadota bacterium]